MPLSPRSFQDSATVRIHALAQKMRADGQRVYNLSAGEPIVNTGPYYKEIVDWALTKGETLYPPAAGLDELRARAVHWMNKNHGSDYKAENALVTGGGKFAIHLMFQVLLSVGDEVLLPSPHYLSYPTILEFAGAKAVLVKGQPERGWKITVEDLEVAVSPKTRMLILNSACNPTGVLYSAEEIQGFLDFAEKHDLWVLSDEVYSGLVYDGLSYASCASPAATRSRVAVVQSASKNFGMTGWRLGFLFGPENLIKACTALQSQTITSSSIVSQWAAIAALEKADEITASIRSEMQARRNVFFDALDRGLGVSVPRPQGAFYAFLPISLFTSEPLADLAFSQKLLEEIHLAVVPGGPFGRTDHVRFSFGEKPEELTEAVDVLCRHFKRA